MNARLPSWPVLLVWATFSIAVYVIGAGFAGSFVPEVPPPTQYPLGFILWLAASALIVAPFVLMVVRLLIVSPHREDDD
jgi:hypothetical protein